MAPWGDMMTVLSLPPEPPEEPLSESEPLFWLLSCAYFE